MKSVYCYLCILLVLAETYNSNGIRERERKKKKERSHDLITTLLNNYNKLYYPNEETQGVTNITFGVLVKDVVSVREGTMASTVKFLVWLDFNWTDERLSWDLSRFNKPHVHLPTSYIWTPDIRLFNSLDPRPEVDWNTKVVIQSDGSIHALIPAHLPVHCGHPKVPHANWKCTLKFGSWSYTGNSLDLNLQTEYADVSGYNNRVWQVTENEARRNVVVYDDNPGVPYINLEYELSLLRH